MIKLTWKRKRGGKRYQEVALDGKGGHYKIRRADVEDNFVASHSRKTDVAAYCPSISSAKAFCQRIHEGLRTHGTEN